MTISENTDPRRVTAMRLSDISDTLSELATQQDSVSVGHLIEKLGSRGYAPFLIVPAILEISPIGGLPGVPTLLASIILLVASQMVCGRDHLWLPAILRRRSLKSYRLSGALEKVDPVVRKLDAWFANERLETMTQSPVTNFAAFICLLLALSVPPLEFIPFASTAPMLAIALIGIALLVHDGWLMLGALSLSLLSFTTLGFLLG
ncbi:MAG: exopolysaccharide biosynthesis protein [Granulosicoccus sp.]|nr:exopolysaccharide biosynthesis protein [Granulosicoccus sp.]